MEISYRWLLDYIDISDLAPEFIAEILTNTGLEVERIKRYESIPGGLKGVVVGEVLHCAPHPNAEKLKVCEVHTGGETLTIVCGAPNVSAGQKVAVALPGTTLYDQQGNPYPITERSIRGVVSRGMICSEAELHISSDHEGIMVLRSDAEVGTPLAHLIEVYSDHVFEIGVTPNRTDALSHYGIARDLSAVLKRPLKPLEEFIPPLEESDISLPIPISVESIQGCPRYVGIVIYGVKPIPSPSWLQNRLKSIGHRPINLLVDLTNYVLHAIGQPLHAFDLNTIVNTIRIYEVEEPTPFVTLDNEERELLPGDLVIGDAEKPLVIAGIMGGANSKVTESTQAIFLESAFFNPTFIRKTAKRLNLHTETSFRFERGTDPHSPPYGIRYYLHFLKTCFPQPFQYTKWEDHNYHPLEPKRVSCYLPKLNHITGQELPKKEFIETLRYLDIHLIEDQNDRLQFEVPLYRHDAYRDVDLLEEFLRIYGYDNIAEATEVTIPIHLHSLSSDAFFDLMCKIKRYFLGRGFQEIITNSLVPNRYQENNAIRLQNPLSDQLAVLRTNFLHSHIEIALNHLHRQEKRVQFMEIGKVYFQSDTRYNEAWQLALTLGSYPEKDWRKKDIRLSYYDLYETISAFLATLDMPYKVQFLDASPYFSYGLRLFIDDQPIGLFGHVHPDLLVEYEMPIPLFHGTLSLEFLFDHYRSRHITFKPLREYPAVERDLSFFIEKGKITYALIQQTLQNLAINTLESYSLFDVYEQDDQVSLALRFRFRALDRTLTDKEVNQWMETIMSTLSAIPGIKLRIEPTLTA